MELNRSQKLMLFKFCAYGFLKNLRFFEPLILLFFTVDKGLSYTQFGELIAVREVFIYLLEIPSGIIADVTGRRRAMALAFSSYLVSFVVFTFASTFWAFVAGMILFAGGEAFRSGTHKAMIMRHLDLEGLGGKKVHYYGITRGASRLGSAASALLIGVLGFCGGGYRLIFPATMIPYALGLGLMLTYPAELDEKTERKAGLSKMLCHTADSFKSLWDTEQLGKMVLNASVFNAFFRVAKDYLQPVLRTAAISFPVLMAVKDPQKRTFIIIGVAYFFIHMNSFAASRMSGRLVERTGRLAGTLNWLFWALGGVFCAAGFLYESKLAIPAVLVLFLLYTLNNLRMPAVVGFLSDRIPGPQRATILSVQSQLRAVTAAVLAPLFGRIADHAHLGIGWVFLGGGVALLALGVVLRLKEPGAVGEAQSG